MEGGKYHFPLAAAGSATPTSSAGHASHGAPTNPELTLTPDHSSGADQPGWPGFPFGRPCSARPDCRPPDLMSSLLSGPSRPAPQRKASSLPPLPYSL